METLQRSQHLHTIQRESDVAVYHTLYGNLSLLDSDAMALLDRFAQPTAVQTTSQRELDLIDELRDRMFLVLAGVDERQYVEEDKRFRADNLESGYLLKGIQLVLTNDCNLGCSYCFQETIQTQPTVQNREPGGLRRMHLPVVSAAPPAARTGSCGSAGAKEVATRTEVKRMPPETAISTVRHAAETLRKNGGVALSVEFFGGEPLVNWPTIEAVLNEFGSGLDYDWGDRNLPPVQLHYSITTNATLVTDEIAKKLRAHNVTVTVSFDSVRNVNRTTKRGTSADALIMGGLEILARHDSILTFNSVVSVSNVSDLDAEGLLQTAVQCKVRSIGVILDLDVKPYEDRDAMDRVVEAIMNICTRAKLYGIPVTGYWHMIYEQITGQQALNLQKGYKTCAAEGCKLSFEPNGDVTACKTTEHSIGNASQLGEVFKTSWYRISAMKAYETTPMCRGCMVEGFCSGLCMGTLQKTYGNIDTIVAPACEVYRKVTERLIRALPERSAAELERSK